MTQKIDYRVIISTIKKEGRKDQGWILQLQSPRTILGPCVLVYCIHCIDSFDITACKSRKRSHPPSPTPARRINNECKCKEGYYQSLQIINKDSPHHSPKISMFSKENASCVPRGWVPWVHFPDVFPHKICGLQSDCDFRCDEANPSRSPFFPRKTGAVPTPRIPCVFSSKTQFGVNI